MILPSQKSSTRILILGASGFLGHALFRELSPFMPVFGTYFSNRSFKSNHRFLPFDIKNGGVDILLKEFKPEVVISSLRGDFDAQIAAHEELLKYHQYKWYRKLIFLSSANVFDAFSNFPSYEYDKTLSESIYGKLKIRIENMLLRLPETQFIIARLPMIFGANSPRVKEFKLKLEAKQHYEVFPHLVMNANSETRFTQQMHYLINRNKKGIFHLGSRDLVHHNDFFYELARKMKYPKPLFTNVYTSNTDRYLAVLPRDNVLPKHLHFGWQAVLEDSVLGMKGSFE